MRQKIEKSLGVYWFGIIFIVIIGILGKLIPHPANVTPIIGLSLFVGANLPRSVSIMVIFFMLAVSDLCLTLIFGYPIIGYFTLFTYTGAILVALVSAKLKYSKTAFPFYILGASSCYWLWTNFGVWLTGNWYAKTFDGLLSCYFMALPFLQNALVGDLVWGCVIFGAIKFVYLLKTDTI